MKTTAKSLLQELLNETQSEIKKYHQLSDKKKEERKIMEAHRHLQFRESNLKKAIKEIDEKNI